MISILALALFVPQDSPEALLKRMQDAVRANSRDQVVALFDQPEDSDYLLRMAERCGGLPNLKVAVFPTPKGWESTGKYWATFHVTHEIEQDHDPVYQVLETPQGFELGDEIPEWDCGGKIDSVKARVWLVPKAGLVEVASSINYSGASNNKALIFRLNDNYALGNLSAPKVVNFGLALHVPTLDETKVVREAAGSFRVGGLIVLQNPGRQGIKRFVYSAKLGKGAEYLDDKDQVTADYAYVTAGWIPSLGRLPYKTEIQVNAPSDWVVRSEGELVKTDKAFGDDSTRHFKCDVPISYPKVIGGKYVLALEDKQDGHTLRSYQFAPVDMVRAREDVDWMKKAIVFFEKNLGPFPFKTYDCFDTKDYYGIESYSYTILAPSITTWAVSHEMGHTYFGGLAPCAYVKDSWNEGVTQYVDGSLLHESSQVTENALNQVGITTPLSKMAVPWEDDGATYWRGGYVMHMLDAEIGHDNVMAALRALIKDRVGKETTWSDLRQYFEKEGGLDLKWFWDQWITNGVFPKVSITSAVTKQVGGRWATQVTVRQGGTPSPFRLRFGIQLTTDATIESAQLMTEAEQTYEIVTQKKPTKAVINQAKMALVSVDPAIDVQG